MKKDIIIKSISNDLNNFKINNIVLSIQHEIIILDEYLCFIFHNDFYSVFVDSFILKLIENIIIKKYPIFSIQTYLYSYKAEIILKSDRNE